MTLYLIVSRTDEMKLLSGHPFSDPSDAFHYIKEMELKDAVVAERILDLMVKPKHRD